MFKGISEIKLDTKGRFALPKKIRQAAMEDFSGALVVSVNPVQSDRCLLLYPQAYWAEIEEQLRAEPNTDPRVRKFQRLLIGHAEELNPDGSGRLLLSQPLRQYASLERVLMMVGQGKKWELWDKNLWQRYLEADDLPQQQESLPLQIAL